MEYSAEMIEQKHYIEFTTTEIVALRKCLSYIFYPDHMCPYELYTGFIRFMDSKSYRTLRLNVLKQLGKFRREKSDSTGVLFLFYSLWSEYVFCVY